MGVRGIIITSGRGTNSRYYTALPQNIYICPVPYLKDYLASTAQLWHVDSKILFVAYTKPQNCLISQMLARWIKQLIADTGINTLVFK